MEIINPKILIIGCGKLGNLIGNYCLNNLNLETIGIRRNPAQGSNLQMLAIDIFADEFEVFTQNINPEFVIYSATPGNQDKQTYQKIYYDGLTRAYSFLNKKNLKKFIFTSSTRVFNGNPEGNLIDDSTQPKPNDANGEILAEAEKFLINKTNTLIARLTGIYGCERQMMIKLAKNPSSWPKNRFTNRIYDEDAANIIGLIISQLNSRSSLYKIPNVINITDSQVSDLYSVLNFIRERLNLSRIELNSSGNISGKQIKSSFLLENMIKHIKFPDYQSGYEHILKSFN